MHRSRLHGIEQMRSQEGAESLRGIGRKTDIVIELKGGDPSQSISGYAASVARNSFCDGAAAKAIRTRPCAAIVSAITVATSLAAATPSDARSGNTRTASRSTSNERSEPGDDDVQCHDAPDALQNDCFELAPGALTPWRRGGSCELPMVSRQHLPGVETPGEQKTSPLQD